MYACMYVFHTLTHACMRSYGVFMCRTIQGASIFPGRCVRVRTQTLTHTRLRTPAAAAIAERLLTTSSPAIFMRANTDKPGHRNLSERSCSALVPPLVPHIMGPPRGGKRARTRIGVELLTRATERALRGRNAPGEKASAPEACSCTHRDDGANSAVSRVRDTVRARFRISRGRCSQHMNRKTDNAVATAILQPVETTLRTTPRRYGAVETSPGDARCTARLRGTGHSGVQTRQRADMCTRDNPDTGNGPGPGGTVRYPCACNSPTSLLAPAHT